MSPPPLADALRPLSQRTAEIRSQIADKELVAIFDRAIGDIDQARYSALQSKHSDLIAAAGPAHPAKYFDLPRWLILHAKVAQLLELQNSPPLKILDIGSGGGQFLHICQSLGHDPIGLDLAKPKIYNELCDLFGVSRVEGGVFHGQRLPDSLGKFDLITIHAPNFDSFPDHKGNWSLEQWAGFLEYLSGNHLRFPGRIFIRLNRIHNAEGKFDYLWPLIDLAKRHGAKTSRKPPRFIFSLDAPLAFSDIKSEW